MRTTLKIDDGLYRKVKAEAARTGRTVSAFVEDALRLAVSGRAEGRERTPPPLPVYGGSGVMPGVDLADSARLRDLMDEGEATDSLR